MGRPGSNLGHEQRRQLVIVALPAEDDTVRQYSSEKEPHLTLLYLGEPNFSPTEFQHVVDYVEHAASQITRFGLEVDRRGELGDKKADVLFFNKRWAKQVTKFRGHLLQDELISKAYHSADQFPEFTPHLTMGFPETPAKPDKREYQRYSYVRFDRISIWVEDSVGPTFELSTDEHQLEVAMSQEEQGAAIAAAIFGEEGDAFQYGVLGMKWGKRKGKSSAPASADAARASKASSIVKKDGVKALSNDDLQALVTRMNLEQQLGKLTPPTKAAKARGYVAKTLTRIGDQQVNMVLNQAVNNQIAGAIAKAKK